MSVAAERAAAGTAVDQEARPRRPWTAAAWALFVVAALLVAYWTIFSAFPAYDDEGTLLTMLRSFVDGDTLYRDIYTPYGPFYYEVFGGLFALTGRPVTTDTSRLLVVVVWAGAATLLGLAAQRLTGRTALGLAAGAVAFGVLDALRSEPMHPVGLCLLLLAGIALLLARGPSRTGRAWGIALGLATAGVLMSKINLGVFLIAGLGLAAAVTVPRFAAIRPLRLAVAAAYVLLPLVVLARDLREEWVRDLLVIAVLAAVALLVAVRAADDAPADERQGRDLAGPLLIALAALVAGALAMLGAILLTGPSLGDVYDGMITQAERVRDVFVLPFGTPPAAAEWAILAVAASAVVLAIRRHAAPGPRLAGGVIRIAAGLAIWFAISQTAPFTLAPGGGRLVLPWLLAWIAVLAPPGTVESPARRFARVALPAIAIAESLQVYPVSGTQISASCVMYVPVGALILADGIAVVRAWLAARAPAPRAAAAPAIQTVLVVAVAAVFGWMIIGRPGIDQAIRYADRVPVDVEGASRLRLPRGEADQYNQLVARIKDRCTAFVGYPSVNSLYLWTGIKPPRQLLPGAWMYQVPAADQQQVVDELRRAEHPCVVYNPGVAAFWLQHRPKPDRPLMNYIDNNFETVATIGAFQLQELRPGSRR